MGTLTYMAVKKAFNRIGAKNQQGSSYGSVHGISVSKDGECFGFWGDEIVRHDQECLELRRDRNRREEWRSTPQGVAFFAALQSAYEAGTPIYGIVKRRESPASNEQSEAKDAAPILTQWNYRAPGKVLALNTASGGFHVRFDLAHRTTPATNNEERTADGNIGADDARLYPDEYLEGKGKAVVVNAYERDEAARRACINHYGAICQVCRVDFGARYGDIGKGFIHVHHLVPLSSSGGVPRATDPTKDLVPVCPNCHAMLHRKDPPLSIGELCEIWRDQSER